MNALERALRATAAALDQAGRSDLRHLMRDSTPDELGEARAALLLIAQRGYARGKDLLAELDRILESL